MSFVPQNALKSYQSVGAHAQVAAADPHRLVQLMFGSVIERLATARGHMLRQETARKGELVSKVIAVLNTLDASLNHVQGGEVAANLHSLYTYMVVRLLKANAENDAHGLDEVAGLMRSVKEGWDGIAAEARPGGPGVANTGVPAP
jgi:flagellar secretion chaperone FliS